VDSPTCVAVDWVGRKLYWTDLERARIQVAALDGSLRTVLLSSGLGQPRDITVDPVSRSVVHIMGMNVMHNTVTHGQLLSF